MRVLLVKMSALGDVVQTLPVATAIKRQAPQARIDWLVERPSQGLLQDHPALERVLVSPRHDLKDKKSQALPEVGLFLGRLRAVRYDWVLDLQGLMKSAIFVSLSRGRHKVGFRGGKEPLAALALNQRLPAYDPDRHALERYLDILHPLGLLRPAIPDYGLVPTPREQAEVDDLLAEGDRSRPLVLLHPVARWESKLWPVHHWGELIRLLRGTGARLAITGSPADRETAWAMAQAAGPGEAPLDLTGRTSLRQLMTLMTRAAVMVSTDTGAMHLAAAMGLPVVALFGPTAPWRTGPHGVGHRVLRVAAPCSPCLQRSCSNPWCMTSLEPREAALVVEDILAGTGGRSSAEGE